MNTIYYLAGHQDTNKGLVVIGGHGYTYDKEVVGKKKVVKNVPTPYGYFVGAEHQETSVVIKDFINSCIFGYENLQYSFLKNLERILEWHKENDGEKLLIVANIPKIIQSFVDNKKHSSITKEFHDKVFDLYTSMKSDIIFNFPLFAKGGDGIKHAIGQQQTGEMLASIIKDSKMEFNVLTEKEFNSPEIEFNNLVTASRWYFNTGDNSTYYNVSKEGYRSYFFGRVDPDKGYYGKATPDTHYCGLFTKTPLILLDKLFDYTKLTKENKLNHLLAGNLSHIKSKEVAKTIDTLPGVFKGNELISPMRIGLNDSPCLVELLNPPGLAYRIVNKCEEIETIHKFFINRIDDKYGNTHFMDITNYFFVTEKDKLKISPEFTNNTLKFSIPVLSPHCIKPVPITLSIKYDCPDRNSFNALIKDKITDIKVWLVLDFSNESGVSYSTIVSTPDFNYVHLNSIANLRVYNLKELGRK